MLSTNLLSFLLELLDGPGVNTSALEDQVTGGGGLTRVHMTNNDDAQMRLVAFTLLGRHGYYWGS